MQHDKNLKAEVDFVPCSSGTSTRARMHEEGTTEVELLRFVCSTGCKSRKPRSCNIQNLSAVPPYGYSSNVIYGEAAHDRDPAHP